MVRVAVIAVALALLPPACAKLTGKSTPPLAEPDLHAPVPITSATTPPIWHAPESAKPAVEPATAAPPPSAELVKARAAAEAREFKKVRSLLEKKVRGGRGGLEEAQLLYRACVALKDKTCSEWVKAKHPADVLE